MALAMVTGVMMLTSLEVGSSSLSAIIPLGIFGFGAGLGMPALTDTVMAAVPEADAGIGSAVNDVSRELGGALGVATIGSVVSTLYRSNIGDQLVGVPAEVAELASESVGVAAITAQQLPAELGVGVLEAANAAFVDAMTTGFQISAVVLLTAIVIAFTLIPRWPRVSQAGEFAEDSPATGLGSGPLPEPAVA
jgi:hypothetical protein